MSQVNSQIPETMEAVVASDPGGPEALRIVERPVPTPGAGEILVEVSAVGVNRADVMQRRGLYPPPPGVTDILGLEMAGRVVGDGGDVDGWRVGDPVCAVLPGGAYARYVVVPSGIALPWPASFQAVESAAVPEAYLTVYDALVAQAGLSEGESVLVHGGSSGIGTAAIQLAKSMDCVVFVTAGSTEKLDRCRQLGADHAINYRDEDFADRIRDITDGRGVEVILDIVGGKYLVANLKSLATDGRMVVLGLIGGAKAEINLAAVLTKRLTIRGSTLRSRSLPARERLVEEVRSGVWPLLDSGVLRPVVDTVFPFDQVADAHRRMESSEHVGKLVLAMAGND